MNYAQECSEILGYRNRPIDDATADYLVDLYYKTYNDTSVHNQLIEKWGHPPREAWWSYFIALVFLHQMGEVNDISRKE